MQREQRYLVFKLSDVHKLGVADWNELVNISTKIDVIRTDRGKQPIECVVVESHWPEYEPTWRTLENRFRRDPQPMTLPKPWVDHEVY